MKIFKKLFAIVLCLALVLGCVPAMTFAAESDIENVPAANPNAVVNITAGKTFTVPEKYAWCNDNAYLEFDAVDITKDGTYVFKYLEFDFYVPSAADFQASRDVDSLLVAISTQTRWNHRAVYNFADQITKDGWNHVKIDSKDDYFYSESGVDWTQVVGISFVYWSGSTAQHPDWNKQYRYANVCTTPSEINNVPAYPELLTRSPIVKIPF